MPPPDSRWPNLIITDISPAGRDRPRRYEATFDGRASKVWLELRAEQGEVHAQLTAAPASLLVHPEIQAWTAHVLSVASPSHHEVVCWGLDRASLRSNQRTSAEKWIASTIFDRSEGVGGDCCRLGTEDAENLGKEILSYVLSQFRGDLVASPDVPLATPAQEAR